jgi:UDP-N-acetylmuramyl pentapeptide phosphotransferase/UDP-N-acetylglucosamine-1-phosphate transferase
MNNSFILLPDPLDPSLVLAMMAAFVAVITITPGIIKYALKVNWIDHPNERKLHKRPTPSVGGLVLIPCIFIAWLLFATPETMDRSSFVTLMAAIFLMYSMGVYDDRWPLSHRVKLPIQVILSASLINAMGILPLDFNGTLGIHLIDGWWGFLLILLFFQFTINAVNFIDGINGLLGSYTTVTLAFLGIVFLALEVDPAMAWLLLITAAGTSAYLFFNFKRKAETFMGDAGSTVIGLIIAASVSMLLSHSSKVGGMSSFFFVAILFWYPLVDSLQVYSRRILRGQSPFQADQRHIHHLLLKHVVNNHVKASSLVALSTIVVAILLWTIASSTG